MPQLVSADDTAGIVHAIEENQFQFWKRLDGVLGLELHFGEESIGTRSPVPVPLFNSVLWAGLPRDPGNMLDAILEKYASKNLPTLWWVGPRTQPPDLAAHLQKRNFQHQASVPGMAIDLAAHPLSPDLTNGFRVELVSSAEDAKAYGETCPKGFELPPASSIAFQQIAERGIESRDFRHYVGRLDGVPVATSSLLLDSGVAGIYNVTTLPEARGRGIGAAITAAPLRDARAMNYRVGILHASAMGQPVYERLGFSTHCSIEQYVRESSGA